jgi:hypothetical protein
MGKKKYETKPERMVITAFGSLEMMEKVNNYFANHPKVIKGYEVMDMIDEGIDRREAEELR